MLLPLWHLVWRSLVYFPSELSGNWLSVLLPAAIYAIREGIRVSEVGWRAMKWKTIERDTWIMIGAYCVLFLWAVIHTVFTVHRDAQTQNKALNAQVEQLRLKTPYERSFVGSFGFTNTVQGFAMLRGIFNQTDFYNPPCRVKVSSPPEYYPVGDTLTSIAQALGCQVDGPARNLNLNPDARLEAENAPKDVVLIHAARGDQKADGFTVAMSNTFHVQRAYVLPPGSTSDLVWIEIGSGSIWRKDQTP